MDLLVVLLAIPLLLIAGHIFSWASDFIWFRWLDRMLWMAHKRATRPKLTVPGEPTYIKEAPQPDLPPVGSPKENLQLPDFDPTDPTFMKDFSEWVQQASQPRQTDAPRFTRNPNRQQ